MSYQLGHTEDNAKVKKAVDEAQKYYNVQDRRDRVEWAGKMLIPRLHVQMAMEKADAARVEQDMMDKVRLQQEEERVAKEAELDEKEAEYIRQVNVKEIDKDRFWELVAELDLERAMGDSVAEGLAMMQATMQDEEVGESKWDKSAEEEPEVAEKVIESSTIGKGKRKAAPARAKMYVEVEGPVSNLPKSLSIHC
jgi:hypothetical protein